MSLRSKQQWLTDNKISVTVEERGGTWEVCIYQEDRNNPNHFIELKQSINVKHHKYGKDCIYALVFPWDFKNGKRITMTVQRVVYLAFKGDIPDKYDIDHIDGDSLNNLPSNLQAISRKQNLQKRQLSQKQIAQNYRKVEKLSKNTEICDQNIV